MQYIKKISILLLVFISMQSLAQRNQGKDTIDTDVVNVVKPYTPTVSDAFKIKETPRLNDSVTSKKREVKYNIFSIPVASTFTPAKAKAATVTKDEPQRIYDNYASVGFGSYTTILGELYLNHELSNSESVGGYFSHHSSQGGIDGVVLDDTFGKSSLNANYSSQGRNIHWNVDAGFNTSTWNWYGDPFLMSSNENNNGLAYDVKHSFYSAQFGGEIDFIESFLEQANVLFRRFGDDYGSGENRFVASVNFDLPIRDEKIMTSLKLDYVGGSFDRSFFLDEEFSYGNLNFTVAPQYQLLRDDLTLNLGLKFTFLNNTELDDNEFYVYPNITASYRLIDDIIIGYGGLEGGLVQNSYHGFASDNPFVSPTLFIIPTDMQYNAYLGIKGKLSNNLSYNIKGGYIAEQARALYKSNPSLPRDNARTYQRGNSFGIAYDNLDTFTASGELDVDVNRNFNLGIKAEYFGYNTDQEEEAWNLPDFKGSLFLDYQITDKWFAGAGLYLVGERKAAFNSLLVANEVPIQSTVTLDSYFDANAHVGYKILDYISIYAKVNNIANQDYQRWINYPVQGIQFMAGATYQFDF